MRLSVVIPALNEQRCIGEAVDSATTGDPHEVIVVDGESRDHTAAIAKSHGAAVLTSSPGRGIQLHCGARAARGNRLLFLHADCLLPPTYTHHVQEILAQPRVAAGAFRLRIDGSHSRWSLRIIEKLVGLRCRVLGMPYGDQAMFMGADEYHRAGGFPPIPVMEDFELVRRLRKIGRVQIAPAPVLVSPRSWLTRGVWRTTLLNQFCVAAHLVGVPPDRIASWREKRRGRDRGRNP